MIELLFQPFSCLNCLPYHTPPNGLYTGYKRHKNTVQNCAKCNMKICLRLFMKVTNERRICICKYDFVIASAMHF